MSGAIFQKLCLEDDGVVSRQVTAVLLYLAEANAEPGPRAPIPAQVECRHRVSLVARATLSRPVRAIGAAPPCAILARADCRAGPLGNRVVVTRGMQWAQSESSRWTITRRSGRLRMPWSTRRTASRSWVKRRPAKRRRGGVPAAPGRVVDVRLPDIGRLRAATRITPHLPTVVICLVSTAEDALQADAA